MWWTYIQKHPEAFASHLVFNSVFKHILLWIHDVCTINPYFYIDYCERHACTIRITSVGLAQACPNSINISIQDSIKWYKCTCINTLFIYVCRLKENRCPTTIWNWYYLVLQFNKLALGYFSSARLLMDTLLALFYDLSLVCQCYANSEVPWFIKILTMANNHEAQQLSGARSEVRNFNDIYPSASYSLLSMYLQIACKAKQLIECLIIQETIKLSLWFTSDNIESKRNIS